MKSAPPLLSGETVVFDHIPSLAKFKRAALFLLCISVFPTVAFAVALPDSYWIILPLFLACILLVQERFKLGRHRAWITNQRIILQDGTDIALSDIRDIKQRSVVVGVRHGETNRSLTLYYPEDSAALVQAITAARATAQTDSQQRGNT